MGETQAVNKKQNGGPTLGKSKSCSNGRDNKEKTEWEKKCKWNFVIGNGKKSLSEGREMGIKAELRYLCTGYKFPRKTWSYMWEQMCTNKKIKF